MKGLKVRYMSKDLEEKVMKDLIKCTGINSDGELLFNNNPLSVWEVLSYTKTVYGTGEFSNRDMYAKYLKRINENRMKPFLDYDGYEQIKEKTDEKEM